MALGLISIAEDCWEEGVVEPWATLAPKVLVRTDLLLSSMR